MSNGVQLIATPAATARPSSGSLSLRGSVAHQYVQIYERSGEYEARRFAEWLLSGGHPDVICIRTPDALLLGLASERGEYSPDW